MFSGAVMPNSSCSSSSAPLVDVASFFCCVSSCGLISTTTTTTTTRRPNAGWCFTGHRPPVPAQSGHTDKAGHGYCKKCFKEKFPELYQQKQEGRKKNCDSCGTLADLVGGLCRPCTRASKCKQCGALSEHRAQVPLLCKRCTVHIARWCATCNSPESLLAELCARCLPCERCHQGPSSLHKCHGSKCGTSAILCNDCHVAQASNKVLCKSCWIQGGEMCVVCNKVQAQSGVKCKHCCQSCWASTHRS